MSGEDIREKIKKAEKNVTEINNDRYRQTFHLMAPVGWINDPNGLCEKNGEYNVFFQYSPLDACGGEKIWGRYTSRDLLKWKYRGAPIINDCEWDRDGVYTGSAIVCDDIMHIFYTGNVKYMGNYDYINEGRESNLIYINDKDWKKRLLLKTEDFPENMTQHIRDPKVWEENGHYYIVLGARRKDEKGAVIVYKLNDIEDVPEFVNEITTERRFGYMWECPDVFKLENQCFLAVSPQGVESEEYRYQNVYQSGYFSVDGDIKRDCDLVNFTEWDMGFDFYAPQTFEDEKGRRILIGWVGMPDSEYRNPTLEKGWQNCLTLPRVLEYKNGKIYQKPVEEINKLRKEKTSLNSNEEINVWTCDIEITNINSQKFEAVIKGVLNIKYSDNVFKIILNQYGRGERKLVLYSLESIRILADSSVAEIYINNGEYVFTTMFYSESGKTVIRCENAGITLWQMDKTEVKY